MPVKLWILFILPIDCRIRKSQKSTNIFQKIWRLVKGNEIMVEHINKADFVPVDFRVLNEKNQNIFIDYAKTLTEDQRRKIIIVR